MLTITGLPSAILGVPSSLVAALMKTAVNWELKAASRGGIEADQGHRCAILIDDVALQDGLKEFAAGHGAHANDLGEFIAGDATGIFDGGYFVGAIVIVRDGGDGVSAGHHAGGIGGFDGGRDGEVGGEIGEAGGDGEGLPIFIGDAAAGGDQDGGEGELAHDILGIGGGVAVEVAVGGITGGEFWARAVGIVDDAAGDESDASAGDEMEFAIGHEVGAAIQSWVEGLVGGGDDLGEAGVAEIESDRTRAGVDAEVSADGDVAESGVAIGGGGVAIEYAAGVDGEVAIDGEFLAVAHGEVAAFREEGETGVGFAFEDGGDGGDIDAGGVGGDDAQEAVVDEDVGAVAVVGAVEGDGAVDVGEEGLIAIAGDVVEIDGVADGGELIDGGGDQGVHAELIVPPISSTERTSPPPVGMKREGAIVAVNAGPRRRMLPFWAATSTWSRTSVSSETKPVMAMFPLPAV